MPKRKYGYVIVIHKRLDGEHKLFAAVEALKISPHQITTGYGTNLDTFSDEVSPSEIPVFIEKMGEPDSFSFIKLSDLVSLDLMGAQADPAANDLFGSLAVISLSKVPRKLKGAPGWRICSTRQRRSLI